MWETEYAREPINYRLFFLRMLKKIWMLPIAALLGGIIIGGIYYLVNMVIGDGYIYRARTVYYIEYTENGEGVEKEYYNYYTWEELANTEYFVDGLYDAMGGQLSKDYIIKNTTATVESDYRYLYTKSDSTDKALSIKLEEEMAKLVVAFPETKSEIACITVIDTPDETDIEDISLIFIGRAVIVGAIIGVLAYIIFGIFYSCVDTSVYLPSTLEKRYHIPVLCAPSMKEYEANCKTIIGDKKTALILCQNAPYNGGLSSDLIVDPINDAGAAEKLNSADQIVLVVKAAAHNGKKIERILEQLARMNLKASAFEVTGEDTWLINTYYKA